MTPDYHLIAQAQKLAGSHVHEIANQVTRYENACELLRTKQGIEHCLERLRLIAAAVRAERLLRTFVHMRRMAMQPPPTTEEE